MYKISVSKFFKLNFFNCYEVLNRILTEIKNIFSVIFIFVFCFNELIKRKF